MTNVEPYKPKPMINDSMVPTRRFPFFNTLNCTTGFRNVNCLHTKKKAPNTAITVRIMMVLLLNQSSSWPFSRMYCNEPTNMDSNAIPGQSISVTELFSAYFGLLTNCSVSSVAITYIGVLMYKI